MKVANMTDVATIQGLARGRQAAVGAALMQPAYAAGS